MKIVDKVPRARGTKKILRRLFLVWDTPRAFFPRAREGQWRHSSVSLP
jgi:hypothetical protein